MKPATHVFNVVVTVYTDEDGDVCGMDESWDYVESAEDETHAPMDGDDPRVIAARSYADGVVIAGPEA